ncbi:hypothetical protein [Streptacidiphilus sp. EB129]|uniref:hypothetical protein n=1 Tax=Streptacidiphilus sp. EB129 TaxID=3156262 RepID=UPI0035111253
MAKTTIQVDTGTRDQLAALAAEQGTTMGALLASWAAEHPTCEQREERVRQGREAMRAHTPHALSDEQLDALPNVLERLRALVGDAAA